MSDDTNVYMFTRAVNELLAGGGTGEVNMRWMPEWKFQAGLTGSNIRIQIIHRFAGPERDPRWQAKWRVRDFDATDDGCANLVFVFVAKSVGELRKDAENECS